MHRPSCFGFSGECAVDKCIMAMNLQLTCMCMYFGGMTVTFPVGLQPRRPEYNKKGCVVSLTNYTIFIVGVEILLPG